MHSVVELHMLNAHELDLLTPSCRYVGLLLRLERTSRYSWTFPCTSGHSTVNCRMSARGSSGSQHVLDEKEIPSVLSLNQLACVTFLSISIASTQYISHNILPCNSVMRPHTGADRLTAAEMVLRPTTQWLPYVGGALLPPLCTADSGSTKPLRCKEKAFARRKAAD